MNEHHKLKRRNWNLNLTKNDAIWCTKVVVRLVWMQFKAVKRFFNETLCELTSVLWCKSCYAEFGGEVLLSKLKRKSGGVSFSSLVARQTLILIGKRFEIRLNINDFSDLSTHISLEISQAHSHTHIIICRFIPVFEGLRLMRSSFAQDYIQNFRCSGRPSFCESATPSIVNLITTKKFSKKKRHSGNRQPTNAYTPSLHWFKPGKQ